MVTFDAETVGVILAIVVPLGIAIGFIVRLEMRVKQLEKELERNPILNILKQFEQGYLIKMINAFVSQRLEGKE